MNYREDKHGNKVSNLGFGCMRFTTSGGRIIFDKAEKEILAAFNAGVNYFDTAYIYPGSEALIGEIFEKNGIREKLYIATKLPHYRVKKKEDFDRFFDEELRRLRTDYVDYYLLHMLNDKKSFERLCDMGLMEWIKDKMESGAIRQLGFSYHGNTDKFCELIDCYDWDFAQIQYNYLDETSQAGVAGLKYAASKGIPVVIMEPLRGGKLVFNLPHKALEAMKARNPERSPAEWGLRWLWNQPEVMCVLSGMNSVEMVEENVRIASETFVSELTEEDFAMYKEVVEALKPATKVGCTGCRYCMPCPKGVDIPGVFSAYNTRYSEGWFSAIKEYAMCTILRRDYTGASNCVECGKCEEHCPQGIEIRKELKGAKKVLETLPYKIARKFAPLFMKY